MLVRCVSDRYVLTLITAAALLIGCTSTRDDPSVKEEVADNNTQKNVAENELAVEQPINTVNAAIGKNGTFSADAINRPITPDEITDATAGKLPLEINQEVERWIDFFTVKDRERFQRFLERGEKYKPQIIAALREQGVPPEIYYQAMIESGFATSATSRAKAVGIWQFMRETGRRYGLRVDSYVDERRDPLRSTVAAALYMKDLYNVFHSWYLAVAAYNAGEGRIMNTIMRSKTRDFWEMARRKVLPNETMNYIPKFIAATMIGTDPQNYGVEGLSPESMPELVTVAVPAPVKLTDIAALSGIPVSVLKDFNPNLLRGMTPPDAGTYRIWVPAAEQSKVEGLHARLLAMRIHGLKNVAKNELEHPSVHLVERGETLPRIASNYGLSVKRIRQINGLQSSRLTPGMRLALVTQDKISQTSSASAIDHQYGHQYRVRNGDSLHSIARRFGVTIQDLKRMNGLRRNAVATGQMLKIRDLKG